MIEEIQTDQAPKAIGPYSQAIRTGDLVFISGQIPIDPDTGQMTNGPVSEQADRVLRNLSAVLDAAGLSTKQVVKTTVYLTDMGDFEQVNQVYGRYFESHRPARATVAVAGLPKGALVEIEAVAVNRPAPPISGERPPGPLSG